MLGDAYDFMRERIDAILTGDTDPIRAGAYFGLALLAYMGWKHLQAFMR